MTYFTESFRQVKSYLLFIPFIALNDALIRNESTRIYALLLNTSAFILYTIVYGSMVQEITSECKSGWPHLLKLHLLNFIAATFILYVPGFVIDLLKSEEKSLSIFALKTLIGLVIQCSTLYLMPMVFFKRQVLPSFPAAFRYLAQHIRQSIWMLVLILLGFALPFFVSFVNVYYFEAASSLVHYGIKYVYALLATYIGLLIFSMATTLLITGNNGVSSPDVKQTSSV